MSQDQFMHEAIKLAEDGMLSGRGGPFGCVIVRAGQIVGRGHNRVTSTNDPTAHAEVVAIRDACASLETFQLTDCELYTSCEPCPMCLAAVYWARIPVVYYGNTRADAAAIGFDDDFIYQQVPLPPEKRAIKMGPLLREAAQATFTAWAKKTDKVRYCSAMDTTTILDFLGLLVRWLHVIAGIAWIGSSFYFIWLDNSLEPPAPGSDNARKGVGGELWAVHGGGFYNPQKYLVAPAALPEKLHWFKWEAYTTWLSGTALLVLVYWLKAGAMMVDGNVRALTPHQAIGIGAASMVGSWLVYDLLCKSPLGKRDGLLGLVIFGLVTALAYGLAKTLGGRAAFIHVGSAIGTIMAANVFFVIIPGQKRMVAAMKAGQPPNPADGLRAKQRSVHNNYFTLPVIFIMVSNHYASTYAHPHNWAVLMLMLAAGVSIRHFFNRKHKGFIAWQYPVIGAVLLAAVAWWTAPRVLPLPPVTGEVTFNRVRAIVGERCVTCHSPAPTFPGYTAPQAGVLLHTPADIVQNAQRIYQQTIVTRIMPLGNLTKITDEERAVLAAWVKAGAKME